MRGMNHKAWARWVAESLLAPLLPVLMALIFRIIGLFGADPNVARDPITWNPEVPFFTTVLGGATIVTSIKLADEESGFIWAALFSGLLALFALAFMGLYFYDENVHGVGDLMRNLVGWVQVSLAVIQLVIGFFVQRSNIAAEEAP